MGGGRRRFCLARRGSEHAAVALPTARLSITGRTAVGSGGVGNAVIAARMQPAHFRLSAEEGLAGLGVPSASKTTVIWSPEQSITGVPVAAEAATAEGNSAPMVKAKIAARNASDRVSDQELDDEEDTKLPYCASARMETGPRCAEVAAKSDWRETIPHAPWRTCRWL